MCHPFRNLQDILYYVVSPVVIPVRRGDTISDIFPVVTGVCQGCVLAPTLFSTCMDWILGRILKRTICGASSGNVKISGHDFADDAVVIAETGYPFGDLRGAE